MVDHRVLTACGLTLLLGCAEPEATLLALAQDVEEGTRLERAMVVEARVPAALATANSVKPGDLEGLLGKSLRLPLSKGDLLLASCFGPADGRLSQLVMKKGRAVTLGVSGAEGTRANDHVDLLAALKDPAGGEWHTHSLLQNAVVLSLGPADHRPPGEGRPVPLRRVTFMLLPEEAEMALLAAQLGALHVALRNPEDLDVREERGRTTASSLFAGERARALEALRLRTLQGPLGPGADRPASATAPGAPAAGAPPAAGPAPLPAAPPARTDPARDPLPVLPSRQAP